MASPPDLSPLAVTAALGTVGVDLGRLGGVESSTLSVERLGGGYSWVTLRVGTDRDAVIVRIAPEGGTVEPYDPTSEARILRAVHGVVPAPEVLAVTATSDNPIGRPFGVYSLCPGEVVRRPEDPGPYREAFADTLAAIHRGVDPTRLASGVDPTGFASDRAPIRPAPDAAPHADASTATATIAQTYRTELDRVTDAFADTWAHPGWIVALRWLRAYVPDAVEPGVVCHGDYRPANILWTGPGEVGGVLDWERARVGDPLADVAFTQLLAGWAALDGDLLDRYLDVSGTDLDDSRLAYARRFERVRSHLSGSQGLRAFVDGRADDTRLVAVGEAGEVGMWELVHWLSDDLPPLASGVVERALARGSYPVDAEIAARVGDERLTSHLTGWLARDADDTQGSVRALRELGRNIIPDIGSTADAAAWEHAHSELCRRAATGGSELRDALEALGRRVTGRPTMFPRMEWR